MTSVLRVARIVHDPVQAPQTIYLLGVQDTDRAIRACMFRTRLHQIAVRASAAPWIRTIYDRARDAAQDPRIGLEGLRGALEDVVCLADRERARAIHALARDELGAAYVVVGRSPAFGTARM